MSNVKTDYNPLSIEQQLRNRLEKRASGVSLPEDRLLQMNTLAAPSARTPLSDVNQTKPELENHFMNLLFTDSNNLCSPERENLDKKIGTKQFFSPLKLQEESKTEAVTEKEPFTLIVETSSLGSLKLNGMWRNGTLQVQLQLPTKLDIQQKKVLVAILEKKLTQELGVQTEIQID